MEDFCLCILRCKVPDRTANAVLSGAVHKLHKAVLYIKNIIMFRGTRVNSIQFTSVKKSTALLAQIGMKFTNSLRYYAPISYTEFYPNRKINVKIIYKKCPNV